MSNQLKDDECLSSLTTAENIWEYIKNIKLNVFSLPEEYTHTYFTPVSLSEDKLLLSVKVWAAFPALENVIGDKYIVDRQDKFLIITVK
jgi:hypothetical protein